ncbi:MAG: TlpA family protein disulfide reductase [Spirochaetaceae bacterium]|jgi:peroxiredoxin|nr:TlpA family protein disulfide reductase [Spirochaetaceae bacterium]
MKHSKVSMNIGFCLFAALISGEASPAFAQGLAAGQDAPDFSFTAAAPLGRLRKLSDYRGKPVALHFWATWCGPCVRELPLIADLTESRADALTVLAVNCAEDDRTVSAFLSKRKLRLNLVMDADSKISRLYNINAIPQTFMIDENGVIRSIQVGSYTKKELDTAVSALLSPR